MSQEPAMQTESKDPVDPTFNSTEVPNPTNSAPSSPQESYFDYLGREVSCYRHPIFLIMFSKINHSEFLHLQHRARSLLMSPLYIVLALCALSSLDPPRVLNVECSSCTLDCSPANGSLYYSPGSWPPQRALVKSLTDQVLVFIILTVVMMLRVMSSSSGERLSTRMWVGLVIPSLYPLMCSVILATVGCDDISSISNLEKISYFGIYPLCLLFPLTMSGALPIRGLFSSSPSFYKMLLDTCTDKDILQYRNWGLHSS
jgi:hypothetical protein